MADEPANVAAPTADPVPAATPDPAPAPSGESIPPSLTADPSAQPPADTATPEGDKPADAKPSESIPEKYEFTAAEGVQIDAAFTDAMAPAFKEAGITQKQLDVIMKSYNEYGQKFTAESEKKAETDFQNWMADQARENDKAIKKEWGAEYDANFKVAQRALSRFFQDKELYRALDETGLVRIPAFMKGLLQVGKMIQEDTPPNGAQQGGRKSDAELFYGSASH